MMRKLVTLAIAVLVAGSFVPALDAAETQPNICRYGEEMSLVSAMQEAKLSLRGNILTAWSVLHNYKGVNKNDIYPQTRAMFALNGNISSWLSGEMVIGAFGMWKQHEAVVLPNIAQNGDVKILNANVRAANFLGSGIDLTVGRQFMGGVEDAIFYFGPSRNGRFLEVTALDAVRAERAIGPVALVLAGGAKAFLATGGAMEPPRNQSVFALELYSNRLFPSQNIKAFWYERLQKKTGEDDRLVNYGFEATGKLPADGFSYLTTVAINGGTNGAATDALSENGTYNGYLWRVIGYYDPKPAFGLNGGYVFVSGDGTNADGKESGFRRIGRDCFYSMAYMTYEVISDGDAEGVENVIIPFLGAKYTPPILDNKFQVSGTYCQLKTDKPIAGLDGKGSEADLRLSYTVDAGNAFRIIGAKLWPEGILAKNFGPNAMDQIVFEYELRF